MDRLHARESQAFVARFFVASFGRRVVECPQQPVRAIGGHGDGVGMVKSYAYCCDHNRVKTLIQSQKHSRFHLILADPNLAAEWCPTELRSSQVWHPRAGRGGMPVTVFKFPSCGARRIAIGRAAMCICMSAIVGGQEPGRGLRSSVWGPGRK